MSVRFLLGMLFLVVLAGSAAGQDAVVARYAGWGPALFYDDFAAVGCQTQVPFSGACFTLPADATSVSVTVTPDAGFGAAFTIVNWRPDGSFQPVTGIRCSTATAPIEWFHSENFFVSVHNPGTGGCGAVGGPSGAIAVTFS